MDIVTWLRELGLERYEQAFRDNDIDAAVLPDVTADDLIGLGITSIGHRRKILAGISKLHEVGALKPSTLSSDSDPELPSGEPTRRPEAERRQLTVMFVDLVGSTELATTLDPEDMGELIRAYQVHCAAVVKRWEGHVAKYMGDGVLAYFGWPKALEDDAERAVRAGLELVEEVAGIDATGHPMAARVGIATGLVVVGDLVGEGAAQEQAVVGETPNLAARLQALALPSTVVIAPGTRRLLGDLFRLDHLGDHHLKGFLKPVEATRVLAERRVESRFEAVRGAELGPLEGREHELGLLLDRWRRAQDGEGQVVLLGGEAGIGKSRLVQALREQLADQTYTLLAHYGSPFHTNSALRPVIDLIERAAGMVRDDAPATKLAKLETLLAKGTDDLSTIVPLVAALLDTQIGESYPKLELDPQRQRHRTLEVLVEQVAGLARERPVLSLFDDAHWFDPTTLELLDLLVERVKSLPALVLITHRPDFTPPSSGQAHLTQLSLSGLSQRDGAAIADRITGGKALPGEVLDQILTRTEGVPLFVEELTKTVMESDLLEDAGDHYALSGPLPPLAIPASLQDSLMARLDRLGPVKEIAQLAAVLGRSFRRDVLAAVSHLDDFALDEALARLAATGLIYRRGLPPDITYEFKHALIQDTADESLLNSARQDCHRRIAVVLEEQFQQIVESEPELLAHHTFEGQIWDKAVPYFRQAGKRAAERLALSEARAFFEQALGIIKSLPESEATLENAFDIRLELRLVLRQLGEGWQMLEHLREAEAISEQLNDDLRRGRVSAFMATVLSTLDELDEALQMGTRALKIARRLNDGQGDLKLRILSTSILEQTHYYRGGHEHVIEFATDNLAALPADCVHEYFGLAMPASVFSRAWLIMSLAELGRFAEAAKYEAETIQLTEATEHPYSIGWANLPASTLHLFRGDWAKAHARVEDWMNIPATLDVAVLFPWAVANSAWALAQIGEADEAWGRVREGEQLLERQAAQGIFGQRGWSYHAVSRACLLLGRLDDAQRLAERSVESSQRQPGFRAHALHLLGDITTHSNRFDERSGEAYYRQALLLAEAHGMRPLVAHCYFGLGKLYRRIDKSEAARENLARATTMYRDMDMDVWLEREH